jgi:exonuclease III
MSRTGRLGSGATHLPGRHPPRRGLQLDHVFADPVLGDRVRRVSPPEVDPEWADPQDALERHLSDHSPVWFTSGDAGDSR